MEIRIRFHKPIFEVLINTFKRSRQNLHADRFVATVTQRVYELIT